MAGTLERRLVALFGLSAIVVACSSSSDPSTDSNDAGAHARCGNGVVDTGEQCDGAALTTCAVATMGTMPIGVVSCTGCRHVLTGCQSAAPGTGGAPNGIGGAGTGGLPGGNGGVAATGGGPAQGGFTSSGGATSSGGFTSSGGATSSGGFTSSGGATSSGGFTSSGGATSTGGTTSNSPLGDLNALRQACTDTINQYRATVGASALSRAPAATETCSDQGAEKDGLAGVAHGSANSCPGMSGQDTCPGWGTAQTAESSLKQCLAQMWAEGEPPEGREKCLSDYFAGNTACFMAHGHYLNMSNPSNGHVSCGFYLMSNGKVWMNQDFGK